MRRRSKMIKKEQAVKNKPKPMVSKPPVSQQKAAPTGSCCGTKTGPKPTKA